MSNTIKIKFPEVFQVLDDDGDGQLELLLEITIVLIKCRHGTST